MNERTRPDRSASAQSLQQALEDLDRARAAFLARSAGAPPTIEGDGFEETGPGPASHYRNSAYTPRPYAAPGTAPAGQALHLAAADGSGHGAFGGGGGGSGGNGGNGGENGGGGRWGRHGFRMNPFAGPGRVDPTIQFVQTAILARPEQTEEILAAALRISPDQAERILVAAIRANPEARAQILRIARSSGALGLKSALSVLLALFLFEVFGTGSSAEAKEELEATSRRSGSSESFAAWFTTAAVALAILFDANAIQALRGYLELAEDDADFARVIDRVADAPAPDAATVVAVAQEFGFDTIGRGDDAADQARPGDGSAADLGSLPLGGLDTLGGLGDETLARNQPPGDGGHRFVDPDFASYLTVEGRQIDLLDDEVTPDPPPPDPSEEDDPTDPPPGEEERPPPGAATAEAGDTAAGEGDGFVVFTITRSSGEGTASVDFATADGSALSGEDYAATAGTVFFAEGQTAVAVTVALVDDGMLEPDESFQLVLDNPVGLTVADPVATATVQDDEVADLTWSLTGNQLVSEGDAAAYTIAFDGGPLSNGQEVSVGLRIVLPGGAGGAEAGDFTAAFLAEVQAAIDALGPDAGIRLEGDRLVFGAGGPSALTLRLDTLDDLLVEGPENYTVVIEAPSVGDIAAGDGLVTTAIADDDGGALVWRLEGDQLAAEGGAATYRVSYGGAALAPGAEASVALALNLPGGPGGADGGDFSTDLAPALQAAIDALGPDAGVRLEDGRLVFTGGGPGELVFSLPIAADGLVEGPENFTLRLDAPSDGTVGAGDGLVTTVIADGDAAQVAWTLTGDGAVVEGAGAAYLVRYDGSVLGAGQEASVALSLALPGGPDGAEADDLQAGLLASVQAAIDALGPDPGVRLDGDRLVFAAGGPRSLAFRLDTAEDRLVERPESYQVAIAAPSVGMLAAGAAAVATSIADNDAGALVWRIGGDQLVAEGGAPRYTIVLDGADLADGATASVELAINLPGGSGGAGAADFSEAFYKDVQDAIDALGPGAGVSLVGPRLVFAGRDSFTFTLPTADDTLAEGAENFTVVIRRPSDGTVDAGRRLVTTAIMDDDGPTVLTGTAAGETLAGDGRPNDISGLGGDDVLASGGGNDRLNGGAGADRLDGGSGADIFESDVVDLGSGIDRIVDFRPEEGDSLHVLDVLTGFDSSMVDIDAFIRFQERQDGTMVQIDAGGTGAQYVDAILLEAVHAVTVDQLMADHALMVS